MSIILDIIEGREPDRGRGADGWYHRRCACGAEIESNLPIPPDEVCEFCGREVFVPDALDLLKQERES